MACECGAEALTFEFESGCSATILRDGSRVVLPCIPTASDFCVQNLRNVVVDGSQLPGSNAYPMVWDPDVCALLPGEPTDCTLVDWTSTNTAAPPDAGCTSCGTFARDTVSGSLTHVCIDGEWYELPGNECTLVNWNSASQTAPSPADCTACMAMAFDTATGAITHICVDGNWTEVGIQDSACTQIQAFPIKGRAPYPTEWVVGIDENGDCVLFGAPATGPAAVDDVDVTMRDPGNTFVLNLANNDTPCPSPEATTWVVDTGSYANVVSVTPLVSTNGQVTVELGGQSCAWSFQYEIYCDGVASGEVATVSGNVDAKLLGPEIAGNGDFAIHASGPVAAGGDIGGGWWAGVPYVGSENYAPDTTVGVQTGAKVYAGGDVNQVPFPGDPIYGVPATNTWLYSNGNNIGAPYVSAARDVAVVAGKVYEFFAYTSSAAAPHINYPDDSELQFRVNGVNLCQGFVELDHADPASTDNGQDRWHRRSCLWTAPFTGTVTLELLNNATGNVGNDLALTAISFREVLPCS